MRLLLALCFVTTIAAAAAQTPPASCRPAGRPQLLANVSEASGIAVSRRTPGTFWTLNDSGKPVLFRFDRSGQGTPVTIPGAEVRDWEDLAVASCPSGDCLYIADIGDNRRSRKDITIYRTPEPPGDAPMTPVESFHAVYPDAPHDAEALLVTPKEEAFIITKEMPPRLYQFPRPLQPGRRVALQFVRILPDRLRITGAAASPDGRWVALRSNATLLLYRESELMAGGEPVRIDLSTLNEPQGEGVAFGPGGELYLASEAGDGGNAGLLTRVNCTLPK